MVLSIRFSLSLIGILLGALLGLPQDIYSKYPPTRPTPPHDPAGRAVTDVDGHAPYFWLLVQHLAAVCYSRVMA
jgi:hypothetical protein